ncbi:hypothetical protein M0805_008327 [Coniferiporia weirii]|nr:hypothetical protein M0805_008327 [Coniferiporia weirii]
MQLSCAPSSSSSASPGSAPGARQIAHDASARTNGDAGTDADGDSDDDHTPLENLVAVSVTVLRQAIALVNESLIEDAQLTYVSKYIPGSTIGKHLRHARDHFSLLLDSVDAASGAAVYELCYDVRARGTPMEGSRAAASGALEECIARLLRVGPQARMDAPLTLNAVTPHMQAFSTSFGRELWFAALHAVHHWSMVRVIAGELSIQLDDSFGIAPSTLVYHGTEGPLGKSKI